MPGRGPLICVALSLAFVIGRGVLRPTQSNLQLNGSYNSSQLPKLCMPVSFRHASSPVNIKTRIAMLADRYYEVNEALMGWNETGVSLVGRTKDGWEAVPCGDDTGLFYIVPLLARQTGWNADRSLDVFLLGVIVASAAGGLAGLWLTASGTWQRLLAIQPIAAGAYISYKMGDVYVVQASVVLMLIPWLVYALKPDVRCRLRFLIVFSSGIIVGLAQWVRTGSSLPVLVFFLVLVCFSPLRRSIQVLLSATLLIGMSLPLLYAQFPLHERDNFLATHQPGYRRSLNHHLFWHTAYVGLSYLKNPYVLAWRDSAAVEYVQSIDPTAIYGGAEYEGLLRSRVLKIIDRNPKFILYTVATKATVLVFMLLLSINIGFALTILCPKAPGTELAFWLAMSFAALPGIIAIPIPQYVLGMITLALYYWYYSIVFYVDLHSARDANAKRALEDSSGKSGCTAAPGASSAVHRCFDSNCWQNINIGVRAIHQPRRLHT
jgi:hypothetical protein